MGDPHKMVVLEAVLDVIRKDNLIENVATQGDHIRQGLLSLQVCAMLLSSPMWLRVTSQTVNRQKDILTAKQYFDFLILSAQHICSFLIWSFETTYLPASTTNSEVSCFVVS